MSSYFTSSISRNPITFWWVPISRVPFHVIILRFNEFLFHEFHFHVILLRFDEFLFSWFLPMTWYSIPMGSQKRPGAQSSYSRVGVFAWSNRCPDRKCQNEKNKKGMVLGVQGVVSIVPWEEHGASTGWSVGQVSSWGWKKRSSKRLPLSMSSHQEGQDACWDRWSKRRKPD